MRTCFYLFCLLLLLLFSACQHSADSPLKEALNQIPEEELPVRVMRFPDAFVEKNADFEIKVEEFEGVEDQLSISASAHLFKEQLRLKILQDSTDNPLLAMVYTSTSIVHTEEPISGSGGHLPAHALDVRFFQKEGGEWKNITETVFPQEAKNFLLEKCNFDMTFAENADQMQLSFAGDKLYINSPDYVNDKILELKWQEDRYAIFDKQIPRKSTLRHPALRRLNPREGRVGLLLGMNTKEGVKTYWINYQSDSASLQTELDYIAVPEPGGFRYLDRTRHVAYSFCENSSCQHSYSRVATYTDLKALLRQRDNMTNRLKSAAVQEDRCMATLNDEEVSFVGAGFMQVRRKVSQWGCVEESPNTYDSTYYTIRPFDGRTSPSLQAYYPQEELELAYEEMYNSLQEAGSSEDPARILGQKSGITFRLKREKGKTMLYAQTARPFLNSRIYGGKNYRNQLYAMGEAPKSLLNSNYFPLDYDVFEGYVDDLQDVFVSPLENVVFILTKTELRAVNQTGESVIFSLPIDEENEEKVVMVEWAVGGQVDQWTQALEEVKGTE